MKQLTNYEAYKSIRKPICQKGYSFRDKTKYSRKQKYKK